MHKFANDRHSAWCSQGNKVNLLSSVVSQSKSWSPFRSSWIQTLRQCSQEANSSTLLPPPSSVFSFVLTFLLREAKVASGGLGQQRFWLLTVLEEERPSFWWHPHKSQGRVPLVQLGTHAHLWTRPFHREWKSLIGQAWETCPSLEFAFWTKGTENRWGAFPHGTLWSRFQIKRHRAGTMKGNSQGQLASVRAMTVPDIQEPKCCTPQSLWGVGLALRDRAWGGGCYPINTHMVRAWLEECFLLQK